MDVTRTTPARLAAWQRAARELALVAVLFIKEVPLRTSVKREDELMAEISPTSPQA